MQKSLACLVMFSVTIAAAVLSEFRKGLGDRS
jgi:hypothetical protein